MTVVTPFERHLQAAEGYLELGLPPQAQEELDAIDPEEREDLRVLALRVFIHQALGEWTGMEGVSAILRQRCPDDPQWAISLAYATRRVRDLPTAHALLREAEVHFPQEAMIQFNLACYECQLDRLPEAREHLHKAIKLSKACLALALEDADLAPLHQELCAYRLR